MVIGAPVLQAIILANCLMLIFSNPHCSFPRVARDESEMLVNPGHIRNMNVGPHLIAAEYRNLLIRQRLKTEHIDRYIKRIRGDNPQTVRA